MSTSVPVLEVGGTHVTGAMIDPCGWTVLQSTRYRLDPDSEAEALLDRFWRAGNSLRAPAGSRWGVAMPDPFDYERGVGQFEGVGKFAALRGVPVGAELGSRLRGDMAFLNDADAFVLGEWAAGAAHGARRVTGITLGTGVGSGWVVDGEIVDPGLPPGGRLHRMTIDGRPLEDVVSRRAIRSAYAAAGGDAAADVKQIAEAARDGDEPAERVLGSAMTHLGRVVARCVANFAADVLVIGGSISAAWDVLEAAFRAGAADAGALPPVAIAQDSESAPLIGAALHATRQT